jgi:hypothetical protein
MNHKPLVYKTKSGLVILPQAFNQLLAYTRYFIYDSRRKLEEYQTELARAQAPPEPSPDDPGAAAQQEIVRAEGLAHDLGYLQDEHQRIYERNFIMFAEVYRQTRIFLEQKNILDVYTIKVSLDYLADMLKQENPRFDREKFINYINDDPSIITTQARRVSA